MEELKKLEEVMEPDFRSTAFVNLDVERKIAKRVTLENSYELLEYVQLHISVPEDVRSYMEATKTLFVYGWFYYPFYALASFLATTAVEMALRARLPKQGKDYRGLEKLFKEAITKGLLRDEEFQSREHVQASRATIMKWFYQSSQDNPPEPEIPYAEEVARRLTKFRNQFAHPHGHWIMVPGQAVDILVIAAEVINQLWFKKL